MSAADDHVTDAAVSALLAGLARTGHLAAVLDQMPDDDTDDVLAAHQRATDRRARRDDARRRGDRR